MGAEESSALAELCRDHRLEERDLVPLPPGRQDALPPLPLPTVGDVYGPAAKEEGR
jgi:hypothetical protein